MSGESPVPGPRDQLVTREIEEALRGLEELVTRVKLEEVEGPQRLSRHLASVVEYRLRAARTADEQAEIINSLLGSESAERLVIPPEIWTGVRRPEPGLASGYEDVPAPETPLGVSDLLINGEGQPNIGSELTAELASAESVDLICAFVIMSGVNRLRKPIQELKARGGRFRVITSTYMGATQRKALDELVRMGAEVRVAYDARSTKLHAKAWLLERSTGLTTAFVGSSNLSHTALFDGLEWNVRLSTADAPHVIDRVRIAFQTHWESPQFERYDPDVDAEKLDAALGVNRTQNAATDAAIAHLDVVPYPHQEKILESLEVERERHDRHRNLVVAATGTGKTIVAALDYKALTAAAKSDLSLLFVAHRESILQQSRSVFRNVLKDGSFGEIHGGGKIAKGRHVFAMIQSLSSEVIESLAPDQFDVVIVDEFHHAKAPTYSRLLEHLEPRELLGLTATPERSDGQDVTEWFGGRIAFEMRLWEAVEEGLLAPFQYFGVSDGTDLSQVQWKRGGYVISELSNVLTGDDARVSKLLKALDGVLPDIREMKALGFCVSVEHARFMAEAFRKRNIPSEAIDATTPQDERDSILRRLKTSEINAVFSVDVLGEGVDVPAVDTVLLLRPTDSATVFTQQIGRGLRPSEGKSHLTVVDLVGQQHRSFRFDRRMSALVDPRRGSASEQIEKGFPFLPSGCFIDLDRQAEQTVLESLKASARLGQLAAMRADLSNNPAWSLDEFLSQTGRTPQELYRRSSWTELQRSVGVSSASAVDEAYEKTLLGALGRLLHVDDAARIEFYRSVLGAPDAPIFGELDAHNRRLLSMLHAALWGGRHTFDTYDDAFAALWEEKAVLEELRALLPVLDRTSSTLTKGTPVAGDIPLLTHARYSRDEVLAALDLSTPSKPASLREGAKHVPAHGADIFFVTLHKTEKAYSPTTMYKDYAISRDLFHWESQATMSPGTPTISRYENHATTGHQVLLFVRDRKSEGGVTLPYLFAGPMTYVSSTGARPVAFTWRLDVPLPEATFESARSVAA